VNDENLIIVYSRGKNKTRRKTIKITDIEGVKADMVATQGRRGKYNYLDCTTTVTIKLKDKKSVRFTADNDMFSLCAYSFMLRLLKISRYLPNFTYSVTGGADIVKQDIDHFARYGKRMPRIKRMPKSSLIVLSIYLGITVMGVGFLLYWSWPWSIFISAQDKQYLSYMEKGRDFYLDDKYDLALAEFDKALQIHNDDYYLYYYKASTYKYDDRCDIAVTEAENGLSLTGEDSVYLYISGGGNKKHRKEIILYSIIGDCAYKLKQYEKAKNAYTVVAQYSDYKYSYVYFDLGKSEYHMGEKDAALRHFNLHKTMIEEYMKEQENSEYKGSAYDAKDLEKVNNWIQKTNEL